MFLNQRVIYLIQFYGVLMLKEGEFIKIEYTAYDKNGNVFDSTKGDAAKELRNREGPILIIYGRGQLLKGLEEAIKDLEIGKEKEITLSPEKAFGEKKKDLLQVMKEEEFKKYDIAPQPGLSIHVDFDQGRLIGIIKSVSSGRILVDFNHPLAGQTVKYKIKIIEKLTDPEKKAEALISESNLECTHKFKEGILTLEFKENKKMKKEEFENLKTLIMHTVKAMIPEIKEVKIKK